MQARFQTALEMHDFGVMLKRQSLRRQNPATPNEVIEKQVRDWLRETRVGEGFNLSERFADLR